MNGFAKVLHYSWNSSITTWQTYSLVQCFECSGINQITHRMSYIHSPIILLGTPVNLLMQLFNQPVSQSGHYPLSSLQKRSPVSEIFKPGYLAPATIPTLLNSLRYLMWTLSEAIDLSAWFYAFYFCQMTTYWIIAWMNRHPVQGVWTSATYCPMFPGKGFRFSTTQ